MASKRGNPADQQRERERLRQEIEDTRPEDISLGMMPLGPDDLRGIFGALKSFRTKFPAHAEGLIARVGKMLGATEEEMAARMKLRPRNDWKPPAAYKPRVDLEGGRRPGFGGGMLADARARLELGSNPAADVARMLGRDLPEEYVPSGGHVVPVPAQGPNAERAAKAAAKATEKIITRVESAIKNAPKK